MSKPAARIGDMHVCPMVTPGLPPIPHVGGAIIGPGCPTVLIGGMPAAVMGDMCMCVGPPDSIVLGSTGVMIGNKPAARMGDMCAHAGSIVVGCPTVLIGEMSPGSPPPPPVINMIMGGSSNLTSDMSRKTAQVVALKRAAESGSPFCEKCEAAREAQRRSDAKRGPTPDSKTCPRGARLVRTATDPKGRTVRREDNGSYLEVLESSRGNSRSVLVELEPAGMEGVRYLLHDEEVAAEFPAPEWSGTVRSFRNIVFDEFDTVPVLVCKEGCPDVTRTIHVFTDDTITLSFSFERNPLVDALADFIRKPLDLIGRICGDDGFPDLQDREITFSIGRSGTFVLPKPTLELVIAGSYSEVTEDAPLWQVHRELSVKLKLGIMPRVETGLSLMFTAFPAARAVYDLFGVALRGDHEDPFRVALETSLAGSIGWKRVDHRSSIVSNEGEGEIGVTITPSAKVEIGRSGFVMASLSLSGSGSGGIRLAASSSSCDLVGSVAFGPVTSNVAFKVDPFDGLCAINYDRSMPISPKWEREVEFNLWQAVEAFAAKC